MRLVLTESRLLKDGIGIISELVNEVRFKIDKNKIEMIAMDPANVSLVVFRLLSPAFAEYDVPNNEELAVSLDNLKQVLRRAKPSDTIILELDKDKNRLKVQLAGEHTRIFNLALIDIDEQEQKIPELNFPLQIKMASYILDEAIEDMGVVAESVALKADSGKFIITSEGNISSAKVEFANVSFPKKVGDACAKYSLEYLKKMVKGSKLSDDVLIQFNDDYPLNLEYSLVDKMQLIFILAPRVSND